LNRQALRDKLAQLSIQIKAQDRLCKKLEHVGEPVKYADAHRKYLRLIQERQDLIKELHK